MSLIGLTNFRNDLMDALGSPVDFAYEGYLTEGFNRLVGSDRVLVYGSERAQAPAVPTGRGTAPVGAEASKNKMRTRARK